MVTSFTNIKSDKSRKSVDSSETSRSSPENAPGGKNRNRSPKKKEPKKTISDNEGLQDNFEEDQIEHQSNKESEIGVSVRRRGGGTIIESRPVFSNDGRYVYVNCGWGVRAFSVETGECVRVFDANAKNHKVAACFCYENLPAALTSAGVFIRWDPKSGNVLHKVRLNIKKEQVLDGVFLFEDTPSWLFVLVVQSNNTTNLKLFSGVNFRSQSQHPLNGRCIGKHYNVHHLSVGCSTTNPLIAYISQDTLFEVVDMKSRVCFQTSPGEKKTWTCIRCHPTEDTVAVGDSIGRILVFRNVEWKKSKNANPVRSVYHWHTLAVSEIAFTPAGSSMYSGGGELTLVKWNLENPNVRHYLPRLSADIVHIEISPYNQLLAVATLDNGIQIVSPTNKMQCVLQQMAWSVFRGELEGMFPAGLLYDPRSRGLLLNGRPGHLQLYSPHSETLTYNIDVTMANYLTQERDKVIVNTHVTHSALSSDGFWLATVETREDGVLALELRLKFWEFSVGKKRFVLTTVIDMPHDGKVRCIKFSPGSSSNVEMSDENCYLVTTGDDKKMRLWAKVPVDSIYRKGSTWRCLNTCFYKNLPCSSCSFSSDGSLLAVGFGSSMTLWDVEHVVLKHSLSRGSDPLRFTEFGRGDCCNLLIGATSSLVMGWDVLTLSLKWKYDVNGSLFVPDPYSSHLAIFTVENQWKILDIHDGSLAFTMNDMAIAESSASPKQHVLAAVFVPRHIPNPEAPQWLRNSYLYYIDIYQELNCLEPVNDIAQFPTFKLAVDKEQGTLFSSIVNAKTVRDITDDSSDKPTMGYGILGSRAVTELLRPAVHSLPPVSSLCGRLLQSFIIMKRDSLPDESDREDKSEDDKTTVVASSDSENEVEMTQFPSPSPKTKRSSKSPVVQSSPVKPVDQISSTNRNDLRKLFPPLEENDADVLFELDE